MLGNQIEIVDDIVAKLPDETYMALSIISMVIDTYAGNNDRSSWDLWTMMYETARTVHEVCGDYKRNEKT